MLYMRHEAIHIETYSPLSEQPCPLIRPSRHHCCLARSLPGCSFRYLLLRRLYSTTTMFGRGAGLLDNANRWLNYNHAITDNCLPDSVGGHNEVNNQLTWLKKNLFGGWEVRRREVCQSETSTTMTIELWRLEVKGALPSLLRLTADGATAH